MKLVMITLDNESMQSGENKSYFVSNGKGEHRFSETYKLHKENIKLLKNNIAKD